MLYHLSNSATYSVLRQAYFSLAESYLRHGITAWGSSTFCSILQSTQNRILKILWKNLHKSQLCNTNNIITNTNITIINHNNLNQNINNTNNNENNITNNTIIANNNNSNSVSNIYTTSNDSGNRIIINQTNNNLINPNTNFSYNENNTYNSNNINSNTSENILNTSINSENNISTNNNNMQSNYNSQINTKSANVPDNLPSELHILNIKSLYHTTLISNFAHENRFLEKILHEYNTRLRNEGRYKPDKFLNNYGKARLKVQMPKILNHLPTNIINIRSNYKKKKEIKKFYLSSQ